MGALHAGHMSLITECRRRSDFIAVSIFVNPTQFAPHEDFAAYPRPFEDDLDKCREAGVHLVFAPPAAALYPHGFETFVTVERLSHVLEGAHRAGHFRGVTTVVAKLFHILRPDVACFGQKDYQQQLLIRRMVRDLDMPVEIVTCPTIREPDGLALSSRNIYLSPAERAAALSLSAALHLAAARIKAGETDLRAVRAAMRDRLTSHACIQPDYATIADAETLEELDTPRPPMVALVAAHVGRTRLIDNLVSGEW
jgi:pantoate--beta-alanine ligase